MPNLQHQNLREEKNTKFTTKFMWGKNNTKFTTSKFTWEIVRKNMPNTWEKTPNLQHQNLRAKKKPNLQHQNLREKKKRQIKNIKIYVRKKNAKFTTSKFTWEKKPPNLKHQNLRGKKTRNSQHHLQHRGQHWTCAITQIEAGARTKSYLSINILSIYPIYLLIS